MTTDSSDLIVAALDKGDHCEALALELARDANNVAAINGGVTWVIQHGLWQERQVMGRTFRYRSFESFTESPLSKGGLASDINVIIGNAMTDTKVWQTLAPVLSEKTTESVLAKAKAINAKRTLENLPPVTTPEERTKRAADVRWDKRPATKSTGIKSTKRRVRLNQIEKRASEGDPNAINLLERVRRGEISLDHAAVLLYPLVFARAQARSRFRSLDPEQRVEFLHWLRDQGVVTRIDINPDFKHFTDGRKVKKEQQ